MENFLRPFPKAVNVPKMFQSYPVGRRCFPTIRSAEIITLTVGEIFFYIAFLPPFFVFAQESSKFQLIAV